MTTENDFWGDQAHWPEGEDRPVQRAGVGIAVSRWWNSVLGGGATGSRSHGGALPSVVESFGDDASTLGSDWADWASTDDADFVEPHRYVDHRVEADHDLDDHAADLDDRSTGAFERQSDEPSRVPAIDPLLLRLGGASVLIALLIPLLLGFGSGSNDDTDAANATSPGFLSANIADSPILADTNLTGQPDPALAEAAPPPATGSAGESASATADQDTASPTTAGQSIASQATASQTTASRSTASQASVAVAAPMVQLCAVDYEVVAGDFWIRIADAAGISIGQLLDANDASTDTALYPGSSICLPEGASLPAPPAAPTTIAPARTNSPAASQPARPSTATPTTTKPAAPATTAKPTTTTTAPVRQYSVAEVQQIIRDVFPDELEERALEIADRESNFLATARNSCCHGVFQLHFNAHRSWLGGLGVSSPSHLYDAPTNVQAAYTLYLRSGGWGPWT